MLFEDVTSSWRRMRVEGGSEGDGLKSAKTGMELVRLCCGTISYKGIAAMKCTAWMCWCVAKVR